MLSDMGMMINRRRVYGGGSKNPDQLTLIHYWEASDWDGVGNWVDSIGNVPLFKNGSPEVETISGQQMVKVSFYNYFSNTPYYYFNFGDVFRIEVDFLEYSPTDNLQFWLIDFGSYGTAAHAFGMRHKVNHEWQFNTKLTGNSGSDKYDPITPIEEIYGEIKKITFGIERHDADNNICYSKINDSEKYYGSSPVQRSYATFNKEAFQPYLYVGRGALNNSSVQTADVKYIKSIKIFKLIE